MSPRTAAATLLESLGALGVDYLFGNPGSEFLPLIEAYAAPEAARFPKPITVAHEPIAVNMAYGCFARTGRPQAVMVHATVGTANCALAVMNASRMRIPLLFLAGRTPVSERGKPGSRDKFVQWAQESFDQGGMLREFVKWDYELRDAAMLPEVLERALAISMSPPRGPVYLALPRELLCAEGGPPVDARRRSMLPHTRAAPDQEGIRELARALAASRRPLILTKTIGEDPSAVAVLERLCLRFQVPVAVPDAHYMNFRADHPCFAGYEASEALTQADVVLVVDMDVPWLPSRGEPNAGARVIHMGSDPLFARIPFRGHRGDLFLLSDAELGLAALERELAALDSRAAAESRREWLEKVCGKALPVPWEGSGITPADVSGALAAVWRRDLILINELGLPPAGLPLREPRSYFRTGSASGLGWGLGAALGVKLASPESPVVAVVGDGAYFFSNPLAVHWQQRANGIPFLTVLLNNGGMRSFSGETRRMYPGGAAARSGDFAFTRFDAPLPYDEVVRGLGGHGEKVGRTADLVPALERGLRAIEDRNQQALVNVLLAS